MIRPDSASVPHVVLHVLDDVGISDAVNADYPTPALSSITRRGVSFSHLYVQPVCSPTRAALLTARYPFRQGLQHAIPALSTAALPDEESTLADRFREGGYHTIFLGKWHLGYARWRDTPIGRGFDRAIGFFQGEEDYISKKFCSPIEC